MQDMQESRGRAARDARSARRAADAAVIHGWEQWVQAGQPSSGPEQQSMQPGSQRWRKLEELEANVDKRNELMSLRQQSLNHEEEQLAKLKNVLVQQQVMLTQQSQFLNGYAWQMQSKEMLLEERASAEIGPLQSTSSSSTAAVRMKPLLRRVQQQHLCSHVQNQHLWRPLMSRLQLL